jgi:excinuclease ABC subunit A
MSDQPAIRVQRARTHNLKAISCRVPHRAVTVVTGPSGAGKSSLAFDTIFAEGQRRFVESMSTYARQFLDQMERPPVDAIDNILPAVALEARNAVRNARSTVGTITEIHDVLRLIFTHLGEVACPRGHGPARAFTPEEAALDLVAGAVAGAGGAAAGGAGEVAAGDPFLLIARVPRPPRAADEALAELIRQGFNRRLAEPGERSSVGTAAAAAGGGSGRRGQAVARMEPGERWPASRDPLPLVLGRFPAHAEAGARVMATIEEAYRLAGGRVEARADPRGEPSGECRTSILDGRRPPPAGAAADACTRFYSRDLACPVCGEGVRRPTPPLFSFNSPLGACPSCQGFGRVIGIDRERVVPDPRRSLAERPIAPWNTPAFEELYDELLAAARRRRIPVDLPWAELPAAARQWVWSGAGKFVNLDDFFAWLEQRTYKVHVRVLLARYRSYTPCPECGGARLRPEALAVRVHGETLPGLSEKSIEQLRAWLAERRWTPRQREVAGHLLEEVAERVEVLHRVGLDYLTLNRQARTLSGGETQRIHLAAALGSGLTTTLYVLDEPTIGLHPQDSGRLLSLLRDLAGRGNTVLVVEHDRTLIRGADHVIDLGPAAGERGGFVVAEGPLSAILASEDSLTGRYLRQRPRTPARQHVARFRREQGWESLDEELEALPRVVIRGARAHNLQGIDVELPVGALVAVTGVSGSGKSTLVENVLYGTYQRARGVVDVEPGECDALTGLDGLADVTLVDQRPLGRSSRSNPITYIKAYDEIRKLFAATPEARGRRISAAHFSFNVERGRCPACQGTGVTEVDMQFMAPVTVACETCQGRRFRSEVLAVRCRGRTIAEVLELTVERALEVFADQKRLCRRLRLLADVGLGYLRLGQSTSTLSGGEAQRLKLASFLDRPASEGRRLFLFDEPTTGLHLADIDVLYHTLRRLVQRGDGVVVVEHSPDLIARCDWIVDLGPGGGVHGGKLLYCGPLEPFLDRAASPTADELRHHLRWSQPLALAAAP